MLVKWMYPNRHDIYKKNYIVKYTHQDKKKGFKSRISVSALGNYQNRMRVNPK